MALVGEAHIIVRAITDKVADDIRKGFSGSQPAARRAGENMSQAFSRGFNSKLNTNSLTKLSSGLRAMVPEADRARHAFQTMVRTGYTLGTALSVVVGGIFSLISGLGALAGSAGGAISTLVVMGNVVTGFALALMSAKLALSGVGKALGALNNASGGGGGAGSGAAAAAAREAAARRVQDAEERLARVIESNREDLLDANNSVRAAQLALNQAFAAGREEIQQLGFDAEDAALAEQRAALDLQKARETLARVQDLPPNSRARQEAELAYQEAELNLRKAKDRSADLNREQDRLARTGVRGTEVVIDAADRLAQAEADKAKTIRDGLRQEIDAQEALADAKKAAAEAGKGGGGGGGGGGVNPYEGLNQAQIDFVNFLRTLKPLVDELKKTAAEAFLPKLTDAIRLLADKAFDTVNRGIGQTASALGDAAIHIATVITSAQNLVKLGKVFTNSADMIRSFGVILGNIYDSFLSVLVLADPLVRRFTAFLEKKTGAFAKFLNTDEGARQVTAFFKKAGDAMAQWGEIFGNIFSGFGKMINANLGPGTGGQYLLDWLRDATFKFENLDKTAGGSSNLQKYFLDASVNAQKILSSIGALLKEFIKLGADPSIGRTFDILATGAPILGSIVQKSAQAGPALAALVVSILEVVDKLTDTRAIEVFFDTLKAAVDLINDLLKIEFIRNITEAISLVAAFLLAVGTVGRVVKFAFQVATGSVIFFSKTLGTLGSALGGAATRLLFFTHGLPGLAGASEKAFKGLGALSSFLAGPWGIAVAAAAAALVILVVGLENMKATASQVENVLLSTKNGLDGVALAGKHMGPFWTDADTSIKGVQDNLNKLIKNTKDGVWISLDTETVALEKTLNKFGEGLGKIAETDLPRAQEEFKAFTQSYKLNTEQAGRALDMTGAFKDALMKQATAMGINVTTGSKAEIQTRLLQIAFSSAEGGARKAASEVDFLSNAVKNFGNTAIGTIAAEAAFQQSIDDATATLEAHVAALGESGRTLNLNEQAGRDNTQALIDMATATKESAAQTWEKTGSEEAMRAKVEEGRAALFNQARQFFDTEEEAQAYVDTLLGTPEEINTAIKANFTQAEADLWNFFHRWNGKTINLTTATSGKLGSGILGTPNKTGANGGFAAYMNGGLQTFANGGFPTGIYKGRAGDLYKFAEPETKWEAFVSGRPGQEKRNQGILNEAASRLGMEPNVIGVPAGGPTINITLNPPPGTDNEEIAAIISREIAFAMRKGAIS